MQRLYVEKRKSPRLDTSGRSSFRIVIYSVKGKPVEDNQIVNLSLGGVAFRGSFRNIVQSLKRITTHVEIKLPNGLTLPAETTLLRIKPIRHQDDCLCVFQLTDMSKKSSSRLARFIPD